MAGVKACIRLICVLSGNKMDTVVSKCHCGSVELELILPNGLENLRRCNCSICSRKNAVVASVAIDKLKVVKTSSRCRLGNEKIIGVYLSELY